MTNRRAEEAKLQAACAMWLWNTYPQTRRCFLLIDNNAISAISALQKRAMGMVRGASDTVFFWNKKVYFIEFKTIIGVQSDFQKEFELKVKEQGGSYFIVRSIVQFQSLLISIIKNVPSVD